MWMGCSLQYGGGDFVRGDELDVEFTVIGELDEGAPGLIVVAEGTGMTADARLVARWSNSAFSTPLLGPTSGSDEKSAVL